MAWTFLAAKYPENFVIDIRNGGAKSVEFLFGFGTALRSGQHFSKDVVQL
jgi:hypothetical protein